MDHVDQLQMCSDQLSAAVRTFVEHRQRVDPSDKPSAKADEDEKLKQARADALASVTKIKALLEGPTDFLQHLASQVEILGCLRWLAEFQILACIPSELDVPIQDLADLTGVPDSQLRRVIRLTATCGFLREPDISLVAHTPLSARFMANHSLLDTTLFLTDSLVPTALHMPSATQRYGACPASAESAYNLALSTAQPFHAACQERSKLGRQWSAYLSHAAGLHREEDVVDVLSRLNWSNLGNACIVEVGAQSTSMARCLSRRFPKLRLVVQINATNATPLSSSSSSSSTSTVPLDWGMWQPDMTVATTGNRAQAGDSDSSDSNSGSSPTITVTYRAAGMPQPIKDAAVYILHGANASSSPSPDAASRPPTDGGEPPAPAPAKGTSIQRELQDYLNMLRASGGIVLVLTTRLLPEPGSLSNPEVESVVRARDLSMLQLANEGEMEITELLGAIEAVKDGTGKLVVTSQLRSHSGLIVALAVKYQAH